MGKTKYSVSNDLYIQKIKDGGGIVIATKYDSIVVLEHEIKVLRDVLSCMIDERSIEKNLQDDTQRLESWNRGEGIVDIAKANEMYTMRAV